MVGLGVNRGLGTIMSRPQTPFHYSDEVLGRMRRPRVTSIRPHGSVAVVYAEWLRQRGAIPFVKLSSKTRSGLRRSRLWAFIRTRVGEKGTDAAWMSWEQYNELRVIEGLKPRKPYHTGDVVRTAS